MECEIELKNSNIAKYIYAHILYPKESVFMFLELKFFSIKTWNVWVLIFSIIIYLRNS